MKAKTAKITLLPSTIESRTSSGSYHCEQRRGEGEARFQGDILAMGAILRMLLCDHVESIEVRYESVDD